MYHENQEKQRDEILARAMMEQDKRVIFRRKNRVAKELEREQQELQNMINIKQEKEFQLLMAKQEEEDEKREEKQRIEVLRQQKLKQLARDHHEVRKLKSQLQELLTKKQQHIQIEQHIIEKELSLLEKEKLKYQIDQKVLEYEKQVKIEESKIKEQQDWYRDSLDCQMLEIDERQEHLFQEFLMEKKLIDQLLLTIQNENNLTFRQKQQEKRQIGNYIREFLQERELFRENERKLEKEEEKELQNYNIMKESKRIAETHKRSALDEVREKIYNQLAENIKIRDLKRQEQEELTFTVARQEIEDKDKAQFKAELEKRTNDKIVLLESYKQHLREKRHAAELESEQKILEREQLLEQLKEDKRMELLTSAAKKRRMSQYHHDLSQLVEYKKKLQNENELNERLLVQKIQNIEQEQQNILEEEKQKIIAEYSLRLKVSEHELRSLVEK